MSRLSVAFSVFVVVSLLACYAARATNVEVDVTVTSVDAKARRITVAYEVKGEQRTINLDVSRGVEVTVNGQSGTLDSVKPGQKAKVLFEKELQVVTKINAGKSGKQWPDGQLRGINVDWLDIATPAGFLDESYFMKMKEWNVNVLRVMIGVDRNSPWAVAPGKQPPVPEEDPLKPYEKNIQGFEKVLTLAEKYHVYIIPVMGGTVGRGNDVMLKNTNKMPYEQDLVKVWPLIAKKFGKNPWLLGYDLMNEPNSKSEVGSWNACAQRVADKIREVDNDTYVIVEPAPWALANQAFTTQLVPIKDPKLVYSFHFYLPMTYTHQGVGSFRAEHPEFEGKSYPGVLKEYPTSQEIYWDKAELEKVMDNVAFFQKRYGVRIFVGEFGVVRWAPHGDKWLEDVTAIFEEHGWAWTFHCYSGWNGWNPTFDPKDAENGPVDGGKVTPRLQVLLKNWQKNKAPAQVKPAIGKPVAAVGPKEVFFNATFKKGDSGFNHDCKIVSGSRGKCLLVQCQDKNKPVYIHVSLPAEKLAGRAVELSAFVKGKGISPKPQFFNGIKLGFYIESKNGEKAYPQADIPVGTFDWQKFSTVVLIPRDCKVVNILVGIEAVSGKAWYSNIKVEEVIGNLISDRPESNRGRLDSQGGSGGGRRPRPPSPLLNPRWLCGFRGSLFGCLPVEWRQIRGRIPPYAHTVPAPDAWVDFQKVASNVSMST